ncbi:MAG: FkbM family methyltransferase [Sphingopyxis sp.]
MGEVYNLVRGMMVHPITRRTPLRTAARVLGWQLRTRFSVGVRTVKWIGKSKLVVKRGMHGVTGNLYYGLHEFADKAFVLHLLRKDDIFYDIGANVGSYTVLASAIVGARTEAFEPVPETLKGLRANVGANAMEGLVTTHGCSLGDAEGSVAFTSDLGPKNKVAQPGETATIMVPIRRLDDVLPKAEPVMMKVDVEGHEEAMLAGAESTMARPSLIAIEIETLTKNVTDTLARHGFERVRYDPMARKLEAQQGRFHSENALFVRDRAKAQARVSSAPYTNVMGVSL